ncbi:sugar-transfer associated ATP-grasp domain-containing protein [Gryllotalpicola daejeonensis]|uniref:sugar-transfer associated ATP-grasp domain-containing protein n=1 Tax=Gryllotalpicola daejeonensis TaxID=993087 RepID=UPI0031DEFC0D
MIDRLRFLITRAKGFDLPSVLRRARLAAQQHDRWTAVVFADMLWSAAFRNTAFNDYFELDFAMLTRAERRTFMTSPLSNHLAVRHDDPAYTDLFLDKIKFNRTFAPYLRREWLDLSEAGPAELEAFGAKHPIIIGKMPTGQAGNGVERYVSSEVADWAQLHHELVEKGQLLVEENITQHPVLAELCAGTVNTTRVNTFFDGEKVHLLSWAQKFGRGEVSDQPISGGFYTMLDENGHSYGAGHTGKNTNRFDVHPESGVSIVDFQLPLADELKALVDVVARVVPQVPYVGWDFVIGPDGPLVLEGNWVPGIYEHKPSVTGIRTGTRARFERATAK